MADDGARVNPPHGPLWDRLSRVPDPGESDHGPAVDVSKHPLRLLHLSPFTIGFFGMLGALLAFALVSAVVALQSIVLMVIVSLFLALGLNPLVVRLVRLGVRRGLAVAAVALVAATVVGLGGWAVVPLVSAQVNTLIDKAPELLAQLAANPSVAHLDERYQIISRVQDYLTSGELMNALFGGLVGAGRFVANLLVSFVVTSVLTVYFLVSLPAIKHFIYSLAPASRRERATWVADQMFERIGGYLSGMFVVVVVASGCAFIFMMIVGLAPYALALAFMVLVFAFIPLVGSTISMVIIAAIGFSTNPTIGIATIVFFLVYQQFEAYVIGPRVMARTVNVPGAIVVVAALSGGLLLGIVGALIAIPTAASILLLHEEVIQPRLDAR